MSDFTGIYQADTLVVGAGLAGIVFAERRARAGENVLLIDRRTYAGYEIGAWHRPWVRWDSQKEALLREWLPVAHAPNGELIPFSLDACKLKFEKKLLDAGVTILYAVQPLAMKRERGTYHVLVGSKSGVYRIEAAKVVDCTGDCILEKTSGLPPCRQFCPVKGSGMVCTVEVEGVKASAKSVPLSEAHGLSGNRVSVHASAFSAENRIIEMAFREFGGHSLSRSQKQHLLRNKVLDICGELFALPDWENVRFGVQSAEYMPVPELDIGAMLSVGMEMDDAVRDGCTFVSLAYGEADAVAAKTVLGEMLRERSLKLYCGSGAEHADIGAACDIAVEVESCDVFVGGAGTCGATCAYAAAEQSKVILADMNEMPGGTGTVGGVHYYWYGHRRGFTKQIDDEYEALSARLRQSEDFYVWGERDSWNPDLKATLLWNRLAERNAAFYSGSFVCGIFMRANTVAGALLATPTGPVAVLADITVDTTGDADFAALCGIETVEGNTKDSMIMWGCMAQYKQAGKYRGGIFTTTLDVSDIWDYTRYILLNRRRGTVDCYDHGAYIATRETRHLVGEYTVNTADVIALRGYPDTILTCFSNFDTKGKSWADIVYFGFLPSQLEVNLPYRSVIAPDIEGLYVGGKAVSCTHDASSAIRMQDDMQNLGGALGVAAAMAVRQGGVRRVDVSALQERLAAIGALSGANIAENGIPYADYAALIRSLTGGEALESIDMDVRAICDSVSPVAQICMADRKDVLPHLLAEYDKSQGDRRLLLARLLLWHENMSGIEDILGEIEAELSRESLPARRGSTKFCQPYPDHGVMAECSYLVCLLSRAKDKRIPALLLKLAKRIEQAERDYFDRKACLFGHIESVAYVAACQPDRAMNEALSALLRLPEMHGIERPQPYDLEADIDISVERIAYLKILLAEASARCGQREGYEILAGFLADSRRVPARCAARILSELLDIPDGDAARIKQVVAELPQEPPLIPYQKVIW